MKFTVNIPIDEVDPPGEFQTWAVLRELATAIERAGVDACYVTDHPAPSVEWRKTPEGHDALDPLTALSFVAAATSRLMVHANVMVLPYRNPFILSKAATTLQLLSGGRLILGAAVGFARDEFEAVGVDPSRRGTLTDETLETLRLIWTGQPVTRRGSTFNAVNVQPKPNPPISPPIWVGGGSEKAVSRAAQWGDGWAPFFGRPDGGSGVHANTALAGVQELKDKIARLGELRAKAGRAGAFDIALAPPYRPRPGVREDADRYVESIAGMAELGVTWTMARFKTSSRAAYLENLQWLAEDVIPRARR
jgi:probable F420-dependent oxidoreductase